MYCRAEAPLLRSGTPVCPDCQASRDRLTAASYALRRARADFQFAMQEVQRLKGYYIDAPKPSADGDLALALAQRTYFRARQRLADALTAYLASIDEPPRPDDTP